MEITKNIFGEGCWFAMNQSCPSPDGDRLGEDCLSLYTQLARVLRKTTSRAHSWKTVAWGASSSRLTLSKRGRDSLAGCFGGGVRLPAQCCFRSCLRGAPGRNQRKRRSLQCWRKCKQPVGNLDSFSSWGEGHGRDSHWGGVGESLSMTTVRPIYTQEQSALNTCRVLENLDTKSLQDIWQVRTFLLPLPLPSCPLALGMASWAREEEKTLGGKQVQKLPLLLQRQVLPCHRPELGEERKCSF